MALLGVAKREVAISWTCAKWRSFPGEWLDCCPGCVAPLWKHWAKEWNILRLLLLLYLIRSTGLFFPFCLLDLAKPPVNEPREPEQFLMQAPQGNPLLLSHTLQELLSKDSVQVELIPEKKGLFLKHVEYEVSSKVMWTSIGFSEDVSSWAYLCSCSWQSLDTCNRWFCVGQLYRLACNALALWFPELGFCSVEHLLTKIWRILSKFACLKPELRTTADVWHGKLDVFEMGWCRRLAVSNEFEVVKKIWWQC